MMPEAAGMKEMQMREEIIEALASEMDFGENPEAFMALVDEVNALSMEELADLYGELIVAPSMVMNMTDSFKPMMNDNMTGYPMY